MSKGLGKIQKSILELLTNKGSDAFTAWRLACEIFTGGPTDAQYTSVRRALQSLRRRGLVFPLHRMNPDATPETPGSDMKWACEADARDYVKMLARARFGIPKELRSLVG